jgi:hypothetical protein
MTEPKKGPDSNQKTQVPGQGVVGADKPVSGKAREDIESPVQKARDIRYEEFTSKVDSGGDKLQKRMGEPASIEERKAAGDPVSGDPPTIGVQGLHPPGKQAEKEEDKK